MGMRTGISSRIGTGIGSGMGASGGEAVVTPVTVLGSGVKLWTRSDLGITIGTGVSAWADQSGNGNDFIQGTGSLQAAYNAAGGPNSTPSLLFDGTDDFMDSAGPTLPAPGTTPGYYSIIARQVTWTTGDRLLSSTGANSHNLFATGVTPNMALFNGTTAATNTGAVLAAWRRFECLFSNQASDYLKIGATNATGNPLNTAGVGGMRLCRQFGAGTAYGNFEICEITVYVGTAPTAGQRTDLDAYYTERYGAGLT